MSNKLRDFIATRRTEIMASIAALEAELRQLAVAEAAIQGYENDSPSQLESALQQPVEADDLLPSETKSTPLTSPTIKDMIKLVLTEHPEGGESGDITAWIRDRFAVDVPRTSMSPQLSRLKAAGELRLNDRTWTIARDAQHIPSSDANSERKEDDAATSLKSHQDLFA